MLVMSRKPSKASLWDKAMTILGGIMTMVTQHSSKLERNCIQVEEDA